MVNSFHNGLATFFELRPVRVYSVVFPGNPSNMLLGLYRLNASGFFLVCSDLPRVTLHHSCFAILIAASPGVIRSIIPDGIFTGLESKQIALQFDKPS